MEENKISSDLIRGHIDTIILYSLIDCDKFAQQISDFIEEKSEKQYQINQATLYSSLKRLENLKYVSSYWFDSNDGRRKFFKITSAGNEYVSNNLSNWTQSRIIIDKLMGCSYTPQVFVSHNHTQKSNENTTETNILSFSVNSEKTEPENKIENNENIVEKKIEHQSPIQNIEKNEKVEDKKDVNFRSVLNELIKNAEKPQTNSTNKIDVCDLTNKEYETEPEKKIPVAKFNESIKKTNYATKETNDGKVDFAELISENTAEGYKIRVSSKETIKDFGDLLINKLRFFATLFFMILPIFEFFLIGVVAKYPIFNGLSSIISISIVVLAFVVNLIIFLLNKTKTSYKDISFDNVLTASIIVFNLLLAMFAFNFVLNIDLTIVYNLISYLLIPIIMCVNVIFYHLIELILFRTNKFKVVKK